MNKLFYAFILFFMTFWPLQGYAHSAQAPTVIKDIIKEHEETCKNYARFNAILVDQYENIKTLSIEERFNEFSAVDINHDNQTDYVINDTNPLISCGAIHGAQGEGIIAVMNLDGKYKHVYSQKVYNVIIEGEDVYVIIGGKFCDQEKFTVATAKICKRQIVWNDQDQKIELGSIQEYTPISATP